MSKLLGDELPQDAYDALRSRVPSVVVATVSPNGYPNTTPVHLIFARDKKTILFAMAKRHQGLANIRESGKVMVCMCEEGDVNVSIRGDAKVIKETMESNNVMCALRLDVIDVKDDSTHSETISGIRYRCRTEKGEKFIESVIDELEKMEQKLEQAQRELAD